MCVGVCLFGSFCIVELSGTCRSWPVWPPGVLHWQIDCAVALRRHVVDWDCVVVGILRLAERWLDRDSMAEAAPGWPGGSPSIDQGFHGGF